MDPEVFAAEVGGVVGTIGSDDRLLAALARTAGLYSHAAKLLGVSRQSVWDWIDRRPELKKRIEEITETRLDIAEEKLYAAISGGNIHGIMFFLKTKGKDRGYTERKEIAGVGEGPLQVEHRQTSSFDHIDVTGFTTEELIEFRDLAELVEKHRGNVLTALNADQYARLRVLMDKGTMRVIENNAETSAATAAVTMAIEEADEDPADEAHDEE